MLAPIARAALGLAAAASVVLACSSADEGATASKEDDYVSCANHTTCDSCTSGMNCFWKGGCCVSLSVNDHFPNGGAIAGRNYAAHPHECVDYAEANGPDSIRATACFPDSSPEPAAPEPPSCPAGGTLVTVKENTFLESVTTGDEKYGCFGLDVLIRAKKWERGVTYPGEPLEEVEFKLCSDPSCPPDARFRSDVLREGGQFVRINPGYHSQPPRTQLRLTASTRSGRPAKICYRNLHLCP